MVRFQQVRGQRHGARSGWSHLQISERPPSAPQEITRLRKKLLSGHACRRDTLTATGRQSDTISYPRAWSDDPRGGYNSTTQGASFQDNAPNMTEVYKETYTWDAASNLTRLKHEGTSTWSRRMGVGGNDPDAWAALWPTHIDGANWASAPSNQLTHVTDSTGATGATHTFDTMGNQIAEGTSRHHE